MDAFTGLFRAFGVDLGVGLTAFMFGVAVFLTAYAILAPVVALPEDDYRELLGIEVEEQAVDKGLFERLVRPALRNLMPQTPMSAINKARNNNAIVELLVRSGNPWNIQPEEFIGLRYLGALVGMFVGLLLALGQFLPAALPVVGWMAVGSLLGFSLPKVMLDREKGKRKKQAARGLPEALDLLRITLNSGQNFQPALAEVSAKLPAGIIKVELSRVSGDLRAGRSLEKSLTDFARRAPSDEVESFCKAVVQSTRLGADVADTLSAQSRSARAAYEADLDKKIGALPTTLFFPILGLMLPALFVIILAPALSNIGQAF